MKSVIAVLVAVLLASGAAGAQGTSEITAEMTAMEAKLLATTSAETRTWIKQEAVRQRSGTRTAGTLDAESWKTYPSLSTPTNVDIQALAFLVLMEAAKSSTEDLKSTMGTAKAINAAKATVRETERPKSSVAQTPSPRVETPMDRRAKMIETASNLMRKMAETGSTTVRNLK